MKKDAIKDITLITISGNLNCDKMEYNLCQSEKCC